MVLETQEVVHLLFQQHLTSILFLNGTDELQIFCYSLLKAVTVKGGKILCHFPDGARRQ